MGHHHHHDDSHQGHTHTHHHASGANQRRLLITLLLVGSYMIAEVVGGLLTNSLALLADAGHMLSDLAALGLSLFAIRLAQRPSNPRRSYGYYRAEILAALANGATLIALSIWIFIAAFQRLATPPEVRGFTMLWIAVGGLLINIASLWILHAGKDESLNVHGAWLHVVGDALGSVGTIVAAVLIWVFGWFWTDPLASVLIGLLIIYSSWALLMEAVSVLMQSTPRRIDPDRVQATMLAVPGVTAVHDLHIWSITSGLDSLSAHVEASPEVAYHDILSGIRSEVHSKFGIDHITIQVEPEGFQERRPGF